MVIGIGESEQEGNGGRGERGRPTTEARRRWEEKLTTKGTEGTKRREKRFEQKATKETKAGDREESRQD